MSASVLSDIWHEFGADLIVSVSGDLQTVQGTDRATQRILRRLCTNQGDYLWEPNYGAGLLSRIGKPIDIPNLQALCVAQILLEDVVAKSPVPTVSVTTLGDYSSVTIAINYYSAPTNEPVVLQFTVGS